jgi:hypothetical protein
MQCTLCPPPVQGPDRIPLPALEPRLQRRFQQLVLEHLGSALPLAAGPRRLLTGSPSASCQGACRFFANDSFSLRELTRPMLRRAAFDLLDSPSPFVLAAHDWSKLNYHHHARKTDQLYFGQTSDRGYELTSGLLVDAADGSPVAVAHLRLCTAWAVFDSRLPAPQRALPHLDTLLPVFDHLAAAGLPRVLVHLIDCEGDSVDHLRRWDKAGQLVLVRTDGTRTVTWRGRECKMPEVVQKLDEGGAFGPRREVRYHGDKAYQEVAEAEVLLCRPAYTNRKGKRKVIPGRPLKLRLVVTRVYDGQGQLVAQWCLLTNVPAEVTAEQVALWYYWRWRIESFFKLLKGAGQQLEHWQQWDGQGIAKRVAVASMACMLAWRAARQPGTQGEQLREVLQRLSGRLVKHKQGHTLPAVLEGLRVLLAAVLLVKEYGWEELAQMAERALPGLLDLRGPSPAGRPGQAGTTETISAAEVLPPPLSNTS